MYSVNVGFVNFKQNYQYAIDWETSVYLGWKSEQSISGYQDSGNDGLICTRFDTEQIDFIPESLIENNFAINNILTFLKRFSNNAEL